jgi:hypothetical protein
MSIFTYMHSRPIECAWLCACLFLAGMGFKNGNIYEAIGCTLTAGAIAMMNLLKRKDKSDTIPLITFTLVLAGWYFLRGSSGSVGAVWALNYASCLLLGGVFLKYPIGSIVRHYKAKTQKIDIVFALAMLCGFVLLFMGVMQVDINNLDVVVFGCVFWIIGCAVLAVNSAPDRKTSWSLVVLFAASAAGVYQFQLFAGFMAGVLAMVMAYLAATEPH